MSVMQGDVRLEFATVNAEWAILRDTNTDVRQSSRNFGKLGEAVRFCPMVHVAMSAHSLLVDTTCKVSDWAGPSMSSRMKPCVPSLMAVTAVPRRD